MEITVITTKEAASRLGLSKGRIHQFIEDGRLPATKMGRDLWIDEEHLEPLKKKRKVGAPYGNQNAKKT